MYGAIASSWQLDAAEQSWERQTAGLGYYAQRDAATSPSPWEKKMSQRPEGVRSTKAQRKGIKKNTSSAETTNGIGSDGGQHECGTDSAAV
jgi:hypothetical protein